jgi:hypothetical protein
VARTGQPSGVQRLEQRPGGGAQGAYVVVVHQPPGADEQGGLVAEVDPLEVGG